MITRCNFCGKLFRRKLHNSNIFEQLICEDCAKAMMKSNITIGVGILHYKEPLCILERALKSVDNQKGIDFSRVSVCVVTDGGGNPVDESALTFLHIKPKYIQKDINEGPGGARNTLVENLNTDYIMFIDCDDVFMSDKVLAHVYKQVNKYKPELYCSSVVEEQYDGRFIKYTNLMCLNMCHGKAFSRELFYKYNLWFDKSLRIGEDLVFLVNLYNVCNNIMFDSKFYAYKWLFNHDSLTRTNGIDYTLDSYYRCFKPVTDELNDWYKDIDKNKFVNKNFVSLMYNIFYYRIRLTKLSKEAEENYLKEFFNSIVVGVNFDLLDKVDKHLNRLLMKNIMTFREAYAKYHKDA